MYFACYGALYIMKYTSEIHISVFFSSRRRHTISTRDWSSDVCSSDLVENAIGSNDGGIVRSGENHYSNQHHKAVEHQSSPKWSPQVHSDSADQVAEEL